jgi:hypothetical protein
MTGEPCFVGAAAHCHRVESLHGDNHHDRWDCHVCTREKRVDHDQLIEIG